MKSTGLFGKNSGRVGGVVYSNYRGQQIVRSYQPQVNNPSTALQVAQRAKFKLVSQLASALSRELVLSFVSQDERLTARNSWIKKMYKKVNYTNNEASLPIEDIVLTNSEGGIMNASVTTSSFQVFLPASNWNASKVRLRLVILGYSEGGELKVVRSGEYLPATQQNATDLIHFNGDFESVSTSFGSLRAIFYAFAPKESTNVSYEDYEIISNEATLRDIVKIIPLRLMDFSESINLPIQQNV